MDFNEVEWTFNGVNNGVNNVNGDLQGSDRISIGSSCCETNILMEHITVL